MKLLIATGLYAPEIGGPATYTAFLEKHLSRQGVAYEVLPYSVVRGYPKIIRHGAYLIKLLHAIARSHCALRTRYGECGTSGLYCKFYREEAVSPPCPWGLRVGAGATAVWGHRITRYLSID
jgi:hypothetical protein